MVRFHCISMKGNSFSAQVAETLVVYTASGTSRPSYRFRRERWCS